MLSGIHISHVFVSDQDEALAFYVGKLGLEVKDDVDLGFMRWLTVCVPGQPERAILLEKPAPPSMDEATGAQVRELIAKGASGFAVGFTTDDCQNTYETLRDREWNSPRSRSSSPTARTWESATRSATISASCSSRSSARHEA